jgi:hypothetical protein
MVPIASNQVRVSLSTEKLLQLMASGALCVADLTPIDGVSHSLLRHIALEACYQKMNGHGNDCQHCHSRELCQSQSIAMNKQGVVKVTNLSFHLH